MVTSLANKIKLVLISSSSHQCQHRQKEMHQLGKECRLMYKKTSIQAMDMCSDIRKQTSQAIDMCSDIRKQASQAMDMCSDIRKQTSQAIRQVLRMKLCKSQAQAGAHIKFRTTRFTPLAMDSWSDCHH